jgi:transcription termination factor Rho
VTDVSQQLNDNYQKIIWDGGDLTQSLGDGTGAPEKSNDYAMVNAFLGGLTSAGGVYICGDDYGQGLNGAAGASAVTFKSTYITFTLAGGNHRPTYGIAPQGIGTAGNAFAGDTWIIFGGCPLVNDFDSFTPVHPDDRLRLETDSGNLVGRMIDLVAPIGKGQRGLVLAPPDAGTTTVLQSIAASISRNNPDCHLMIVLLDERPEEVTDFQRQVKGEVIASTFDRPATDHTMVAELAIERAKRLVELGHDVVVLLDSLTRLGRAYNLAAPPNGRVLAGNVDATALHPPKQFFGAARNIEQGGSLTILATALVDTGSATDEVILEEFTGTANSVLRLSGDVAARRTFPAVDVLASGTRREDLLLTREELEIVEKLRRSLLDRTPVEAHDDVLGRVRATQSNIELLTQVQRTPMSSAAKRR